MKLNLFVVFIIGYALAAQGTPAKTSYCMGNVDGATTCSACFNWKTGPRQLASAACTAATNKITDCKWYYPQLASTKSYKDCGECDGKTWLNFTAASSESATTMACSDTAVDATVCKSKVSNSDQSYCWKPTSGTSVTGCRYCSKGYKGGATAGPNVAVGTTTCIAATITNCDYMAPWANTSTCYFCKSKYAVNNAGTACTSFTTDTNCKSLASGNTYCGQCWNAYYFETTKCILASKILAISGMLAALFFINW